MTTIQTVRCPNCGSLAKRDRLVSLSQIKTECHECDYLMITCSLTGKVVEAHAPGLLPSKIVLMKTARKELHLKFDPNILLAKFLMFAQ